MALTSLVIDLADVVLADDLRAAGRNAASLGIGSSMLPEEMCDALSEQAGG
jgi:hypothetical protein